MASNNTNNSNNPISLAPDRRMSVNGFTFRIAEKDEILPQYEVFNYRYDRERKLKDMPNGYLPLCRPLPNCQADLTTLVAVQTDLAEDILIAASGGHTSANLMNFYIEGCKKAPPTLATQVHRLNKIKVIFPFFSHLTGYNTEEKDAKPQPIQKESPKQENAPAPAPAAPASPTKVEKAELSTPTKSEKTTPSTPAKVEKEMPAATAKSNPETSGAASAPQQVDGLNLPLLIELIEKARGDRSVQKFANECCIPYSSLYNILHGKRQLEIQEMWVRTIVNHADPNSGVTLEMLSAANGTPLKSRSAKSAAKSTSQKAPSKATPVAIIEETPIADPAEAATVAAFVPEATPAPAPVVEAAPVKPICYNVFEVIKNDTPNGVQRIEEYVCSFVEEEDAKKFAKENSYERVYNRLQIRGIYIVRPGFLISHSSFEKGVNLLSMTVEATMPKIPNPKERGYNIFIISKYYEDARVAIIPGAAHIQALDNDGHFLTDWDAAKQAEKDGIAIIHDMPGVEDWTYIDTPENRVLIESVLPKYPRCDVRSQRQRPWNMD